MHVMITHSDGWKCCWTVNELIDAIICDRVNFPSETSRDIRMISHEDYLNLYYKGNEDDAPKSPNFTCYHYCRIDDTASRIIENRYKEC